MKKLDFSKPRVRPDPAFSSGAFELQAIWAEERTFLASIFQVWKDAPDSADAFDEDQVEAMNACVNKHAPALVRDSRRFFFLPLILIVSYFLLDPLQSADP